MTEKELLQVIQNNLYEVSKVFSQNSTAIAREFTLKQSENNIKEALQSYLSTLKATPEVKDENKRTNKQKN